MISTYQQLCPVLFGVGAIDQIADKVKAFGAQRAFCVFDKGVEAAGIGERIVNLLINEGIDVAGFNGVLPDAPVESVEIAGKAAKSFGAEIVLGIGGGSSLDTAKAVAVLVDNPAPISRYYAGKGEDFKINTPLILIPTASGTGSEVTIMSVLHDQETKGKETILRSGDLAIVDPELTVTVPPHVTAATGLDAMSHAIESYTTNCGNPKADILSLAAVKLIVENLEKACKDGNDIVARTNLSLASNLAGMAFNDASVHFGHAAAHEFGIQFHMAHGVACAITLPEVVVFAAESEPEKVRKIAEALGVDVPFGASAKEIGRIAAESIRELMRKTGIMSLKEQGITREEAIRCAKSAVQKNWFVSCALRPVDENVMAEQIANMYDHYQ